MEKHKQKEKSFHNRILVAFILVTMLNFIFFVVFVRANGWRFLNHLTDENLKVLMNVIENSIIDDLDRGNYERIEHIINKVNLEDAGIDFCRIYDWNGLMVAQEGENHLLPVNGISDEFGIKILSAGDVYFERQEQFKIIGWRFLKDDRIVGAAAVCFGNDIIYNQMKRVILILFTGSLFSMILGVVVFAGLLGQISRPLRRLARIMKHYGEDDFHLDFEYKRLDEIHILADALKKMDCQVRDSFKKLKSSEERFDLAVQGSKDGIWDYLTEEHILYSSPRCLEILGIPSDEGLDGLTSWFKRIAEEDKDRMRSAIRGVRERNVEYLDVEYRFIKDDGHMIWVRSRGKGSYDKKGHCVRIAGSLSDISERKAAEERLVQVALYDPLTSLPNRVFLLERLHQVVEGLKRKPRSRFAILFLDYDGFKKVNDTYGHGVGDLLLQAIAERLKGCLRSQDMVARIGGDEFVILLEDCGGKKQIKEVAERIQYISTREFNLKNNSIILSVSIGIALGSLGYEKLEDLIQYADIAMYAAKNDGKRCYRFYRKEMQTRISRQWEIHVDLHKAVERDELYLQYQPIVSLQENKLTGAEALIRWRHPHRGLISPAEFIASAEESAFVTRLTDWLIRELKTVCLDKIIDWEDDDPFRIGFNVSSKDFVSHPDLSLRILENFSGCESILHRLDVEVTETSLIDNFEAVNLQLQKLKSSGMKVKLDDFGTGYSSLSYLHSFPLDCLKIDRSFISSLPQNRENLNIIKHTIALAHDIGLEVVAEGIETEEQHFLLRELGCDKGQGYLYSKPLSFDDFLLFRAAASDMMDDLEGVRVAGKG